MASCTFKNQFEKPAAIENVLMVLMVGLHRNEEEWHFKIFRIYHFQRIHLPNFKFVPSYGVWTMVSWHRYDTSFWMVFHEIEIKIDLPFWYRTDLGSDHFHLPNVICALLWLIANCVRFSYIAYNWPKRFFIWNRLFLSKLDSI